MSRRCFVPLLVAILLAVSLSACAQPPSFLKLTLLSTNDLHAHLSPFDLPQRLAGSMTQTKNLGGAARRATYVNRVRSESSTPVLLLDSGDTTHGYDPLAQMFRGAPDVEVMNALGYVAMVPGNHDFQWKSSDTLRNLRASKFPWVCANLIEKKTGKLLLEPYVIRDYYGVRVAFFGLITAMVNGNGNLWLAARELELQQVDAIEAAKNLIPTVRQNADIVICLSHLGAKLDQQLAKAVPGIDIILGGHSHTRLPQPVMVPIGKPTGTSLGAVPVIQSGSWGAEIGHHDAVFHRDPTTGAYSLMSLKSRLVLMDSAVPDDPAIAALVAGWESRRAAVAAYAPAPKPAATVPVK